MSILGKDDIEIRYTLARMLLRAIVGLLIIVAAAKLSWWPTWAGWLAVVLVGTWIWRTIPVPAGNDYMTPETFRQLYLGLSGAPKAEEVDLLVRAGLGEPHPLSPRFLRRAATAANQLHRWLAKHPTATPEQRLARARKVVDRNGPRSVSSGHLITEPPSRGRYRRRR